MAAAAAIAAGCGHLPPSWPDVPRQLADDHDRDEAIDRLWVVPAGPARDALRAELAHRLAREVQAAVASSDDAVAERLELELVGLWRDDPAAIATGLRPQLATIEAVRGHFAREGRIGPTITAVAVLAELEPARRGEHLAELDDMLAFADVGVVVEYGAGAGHAMAIAELAPTALAMPLPWIVDRYVAMLEERQRSADQLFATSTPAPAMVRIHRDLPMTAQRIAIALARAGRIDEIAAHLRGLHGVYGVDPALAKLATAVAERPTPDAYLALTRALRGDPRGDDVHAGDAAAAFKCATAGLAKFPRDPSLALAAAEASAGLGRVDQAIALFEDALARTEDIDPAMALRLGRVYGERIDRLAAAGRPAEAIAAWRAVVRYTDARSKRGPRELWIEVAALGEAALGKGLVGQGRIRDGERALTAAIDRAPPIEAYETLATVYFKLGQLEAAQQLTTAALASLGDQSTGDRYHRAKLGGLAGDVARTAGRHREAVAYYLDTLRNWAALGDAKDLPRMIAAERELDGGRALWFLGQASRAVELIGKAVEDDPDDASIADDAVAFLIEIGQPAEAAEAFHRAISSPGLTEVDKTAMALWLAGDAHRRGATPDTGARAYLASRSGDLWHEQLAEAATGRRAIAELRTAASTGPRRGELAFYSAVLGWDPTAASPAGAKELLRAAIAERAVLENEYDLARAYLAAP